MRTPRLHHPPGGTWLTSHPLLVLLGLVVLILGCSRGGGEVPPPPTPSPAAEHQTIQRLLALYRMALVQEDIDRLQDLLQAGAALPQGQTSVTHQEETTAFQEAQTFREAMTTAFRAIT